MRQYVWFFWLIITLVGSAGAAHGQSSSWLSDEAARVRLIAADNGVTGAGDVLLGLQFRLEKGWKTYWRHPGESGVPPRFSWQGSENLRAVSVDWPVPERFTAFGFESIGYSDEVVLPLRIKVDNPSAALKANLQLEYMICSDICVPLAGTLTLALPAAEGPTPTVFREVIEHYAAQVPDIVQIGEPGIIQTEAIERVGKPGQEHIHARFIAPAGFESPELFCDLLADFGFSKPVMTVSQDRRALDVRFAVEAFNREQPSLAGETLVLTLADGGHAVEVRWQVPPGDA